MGKNPKLALTLNLIFFLIVFVIHLLRLILGFEVNFASWAVPSWISIVAVFVIGILIYLNYKAL